MGDINILECLMIGSMLGFVVGIPLLLIFLSSGVEKEHNKIVECKKELAALNERMEKLRRKYEKENN